MVVLKEKRKKMETDKTLFPLIIVKISFSFQMMMNGAANLCAATGPSFSAVLFGLRLSLSSGKCLFRVIFRVHDNINVPRRYHAYSCWMCHVSDSQIRMKLVVLGQRRSHKFRLRRALKINGDLDDLHIQTL